ncbi:MAG: tyrosine-type recombinase/integrase [Candidatus Thiodiazotropha lotti]
MQLKHGAYYYVHKNKWTKLSDDYSLAIKKWAEIESTSDRARSVSAMLDKYIAKHGDRLAPKTIQGYSMSAENIKPAFAGINAEEVTPAMIAEYRDNRSAKTAANREIALLSAAFNDVIELGWVTVNPCRGIKKNPTKKIDRYVTDEELEELIKHGKQLAVLIEVGYSTGLRKSDLINLKIGDFTDEGLVVTNRKTGYKHLFEWSPALRKAKMQSKYRPFGLERVFVNTKGKPWTESSFNTSWRRVKDRAEVECRFHDIRAKALTDAKKKIGIEYAQELAGHGSVTTTEVYTKGRLENRVKPLR